MYKFVNFLAKPLFVAAMFYNLSSFSIGPAKPRLSQITYNGASVLPISTSKSGQKIVLLGRETGGRDKGTYDAFGGGKDQGETHPLISASREFAEETAYNVFSNNNNARDYIDDKNHTKRIVVNKKKKTVYYLTNFNYDKLNVKNFYNKRSQAKSFKQKEKDKLAWVKLSDLKTAIANASRNVKGVLNTPITVKANIINPKGPEDKNITIKLRPIFVSSLQSYFKGKKADQVGCDPRVKIYNS